jgi:hypothetical protein
MHDTAQHGAPTFRTAYQRRPTQPDSAHDPMKDFMTQCFWFKCDVQGGRQLHIVVFKSRVPVAGRMLRTCLPLSFQAFTDDLIQLDMLMNGLRQSYAAR